MTRHYDKARYFSFIIYPESIPENWQDCLEKLGVPMAVSPLHDKDLSNVDGQEFKKAHYHVLYIAKNPVTVESVRNKIKRALGLKSVNHIEPVDSVEYYYKYLTHESKDAIRKKKHVYDSKDIVYINDFDIDRYVSLDDYQKKQVSDTIVAIINKNLIPNSYELGVFIENNGAKYGIKISDLNAVLKSSPGYFNLIFNGVYQHLKVIGSYKVVDPETGEIKDYVNKQK